MQYDEPDLLRRAMAAYYRAGGRDQPSDAESNVAEIEGRVYVVLRNVSGPLAVYRLTSQDKIRVLRRWPAEFKAEA
ncbi:MAG: hypothetical protein LC687_07315 [Actinobacteria bacterium]|nr:hypothetical protein [Actinomycetota bacterium]